MIHELPRGFVHPEILPVRCQRRQRRRTTRGMQIWRLVPGSSDRRGESPETPAQGAVQQHRKKARSTSRTRNTPHWVTLGVLCKPLFFLTPDERTRSGLATTSGDQNPPMSASCFLPSSTTIINFLSPCSLSYSRWIHVPHLPSCVERRFSLVSL